MFPMTITINNQQQFNTVMNALSCKADAPSAPAATAPKPAADKPAAEKTESAAAAPEAKAYTIQDAKDKIVAVGKAKGSVTGRAILDNYKVKVAANLPEDQIAAFIADCDKALAA